MKTKITLETTLEDLNKQIAREGGYCDMVHAFEKFDDAYLLSRQNPNREDFEKFRLEMKSIIAEVNRE